MNGWRQITCGDRDLIDRAVLRPGAGLTDLGGRFGDPQIYTEWIDAAEVPVLRDYRWPSAVDGQPDARPCQHWIPEAIA